MWINAPNEPSNFNIISMKHGWRVRMEKRNKKVANHSMNLMLKFAELLVFYPVAIDFAGSSCIKKLFKIIWIRHQRKKNTVIRVMNMFPTLCPTFSFSKITENLILDESRHFS